MAVAYVRGSGMTSGDHDSESSTVSALKEQTEYLFPDGEILTVVPGALAPDESGELVRKIKRWEKDSLIARKASGEIAGSIRDTRNRYGDPKEWDHLQFMLDREESDIYSPADLARMRDIIRDIASKDASGNFQKMAITRIHTDTGNAHIDVFVHRHPFNPVTNETKAAEELTGQSFLPALTQKINAALFAAELPVIKDVKKQDGQSLYEESATSERAKQTLNTMLSEEGGLPTQRTGAPVVYGDDEPRPTRMRIQDPDAKLLQNALLEAEREAKAAAQKLINAQNAIAAVTERAELRARLEEAEAMAAAQEAAIEAARVQHAADLAEREAAIAALNTDIEKAGERETGLRSELETVLTKVEEQTAQIVGLTDDFENAQGEIAAQVTKIATLQGELFTLNGQVTEQADQLAERAQTIAEQARSIESLTGEVDRAKAIISTQADEIAARDATIGQLNTEVNTTAAALATAKETISNQTDEIEGLRSTVHQRDIEIAKATGAIESRDMQIKTITKERDDIRTTAEKLNFENGSMKAVQTDILTKLARVIPAERASNLSDAFQAFVEKYVTDATKSKEFEAKVAELEKEIVNLQQENVAMRSVIEEVQHTKEEGTGEDDGEGGTGEGGTRI